MAAKFSPRHDEIIRDFLVPRTEGVRSDLIAEEERLHSLDPISLNWDEVAEFERYYFAKRTKASSEKEDSTGKKRYYSENGFGFWRSLGDKIPIQDPTARRRGVVLGYYQDLQFCMFDKDPKRFLKTEWLMREYRLPRHDHLHHRIDEWVVCLVKDEPEISTAESNGTSGITDVKDDVALLSLQEEVSSRSPDEEYHHPSFVESLNSIPEQEQEDEDDLLIPNYFFTRGLTENPVVRFFDQQ